LVFFVLFMASAFVLIFLAFYLVEVGVPCRLLKLMILPNFTCIQPFLQMECWHDYIGALHGWLDDIIMKDSFCCPSFSVVHHFSLLLASHLVESCLIKICSFYV
jgi:hypothetical protein